MPNHERRTSIVATLGPVSAEPAVVRQLIAAGVDVFRLNFSHGDHAWHRQVHINIRQQAAALARPVTVLADLCGPKIRVGNFRTGSIELSEGEPVTVTTRSVVGQPGLIPCRYRNLHEEVRPDERILLADGRLQLVVEKVDDADVHCRVVDGGTLLSGKGVNLPDSHLSVASLTDKDRADARFALGLGVDFLALSFVRSADDIEDLRAVTADAVPDGDLTPLIAKIETPEAVVVLDDLLATADGVMVARGDLGVELGPEYVPVVQRDVLARSRMAGKPAIVATHMLESMIEQAVPTRAEVADISGAVVDGADAVMLSAETAQGRHPVRVVKAMDRIVRQAEAELWSGNFAALRAGSATSAIARSTAQLSGELRAGAIVVFSAVPGVAAAISAARPLAPIVAVAPTARACGRIGLLWGVVPQVAEVGYDEQPGVAKRLVADLGLAAPGLPILAVMSNDDVVSVSVLAA